MKKVLIIGDSISIGYTPHAATALGAGYEVIHNEGNGGDSSNLLDKLEGFLADAGPVDVIHVNCGLHDVRLPRDTGEHQVPLDAYRENLRRIVERLGRTGARLIWARTTPVLDDRHAATHDTFDRRQADIDAYNAAADTIVAEAGLAVNDLHAALEAEGARAYIRHDDGVHMNDDGYALLGRRVADTIERVAG